MSRPSECVDCGTPMLPKRRGFPPPEGFVYHSSKGVCERCYSRAHRARERAIRAAAPQWRMRAETPAERDAWLVANGWPALGGKR